MGRGHKAHLEQTYGPQRSLNLKSRIFVLLRDELGLNKQPKVARLLASEIQTLIDDTVVDSKYMKPGQLLLLAPEIGQRPSWKHKTLAEKKMKALQLTLIDEDDVDKLCRGESATGVRRHRMVRLIKQAYEQGATLTSSQLSMMTGIGATRVSMQLREYMKETGETLPTRGIVEDCSPAITHKVEIIERHLRGEITSEIAKNTNHTPKSVERYIRRFEQVRELADYLDKEPDIYVMARILGCSERLVAAYLELIPSDHPQQAVVSKNTSSRPAKKRLQR